MILKSPEIVFVDENCFNQNDFKKLTPFKQLYYKNKFEGVISTEASSTGIIYPATVKRDKLLDGIKENLIKKSYRLNQHLLLTNHENKNFIMHNAALFARFKQLTFRKYSLLAFMPKLTLNRFVEKNKIDRVIFNLPYKHLLKMKLLKKVRELKLPYSILERGALPHCLIWDDHDFNVNSKYYDSKFWKSDFSEEEKKYMKKWTKEIKLGASLEAQAGAVASQKKISDLKTKFINKKIIFTPLQRPRDSVIKYFCPLGYDSFIKSIVEFSKKHSDEYVVLVKKHPLEKKWPKILEKNSTNNIVLIDSEVHVNDLIKISDAVVLINSGVGVVSMVFHKPVFYFGQIFYSVPGCNVPFSSAGNLYEKLAKQTSYNSEDADKFLTYLYARYYCLVDLVKVPFKSKVIHKYIKFKGLD